MLKPCSLCSISPPRDFSSIRWVWAARLGCAGWASTGCSGSRLPTGMRLGEDQQGDVVARAAVTVWPALPCRLGFGPGGGVEEIVPVAGTGDRGDLQDAGQARRAGSV